MFQVVIIDADGTERLQLKAETLTMAVAEAKWCSRECAAAIFVGNRKIAYFKAGKTKSFKFQKTLTKQT